MKVFCVYCQDPIPTSLLKMPNDMITKAVKMFMSILKFTENTGESDMDDGQRLELAQRLLAGSLKKIEIKDEMYMQLLKQTRGNPEIESSFRAWTLFHLLAASMPPSKVSKC